MVNISPAIIIAIIVIIFLLGAIYYINNSNKKMDEIKDRIKILDPREKFTVSVNNKNPPENITIDFNDMDDETSQNNESDQNIFTMKKKKYKMQDQSEIEKQFDIDSLLPQEIIEDGEWFDTSMLQTKKIDGDNFVNPTAGIGIDTVSTNNKYSSLDLRGDIPITKKNVSPFLNSSKDSDYTQRGICIANN
jgi:hypothetical protein